MGRGEVVSMQFDSMLAQCETHAQRMLWAQHELMAKLPLSSDKLRGLNKTGSKTKMQCRRVRFTHQRYWFVKRTLHGDVPVCQRGFTLIELIMTMVIVGILAVAVAPRFFDNNVFQSRGFADEVQATLRYAQKVAVAQRRNVCVAITASDISLTSASVGGAASPCDNSLASPAGQPAGCPSVTYRICAPSGVTLAFDSASTIFDALGSSTANTITISTISGAANPIVVEAVTGYVHSP